MVRVWFAKKCLICLSCWSRFCSISALCTYSWKRQSPTRSEHDQSYLSILSARQFFQTDENFFKMDRSFSPPPIGTDSDIDWPGSSTGKPGWSRSERERLSPVGSNSRPSWLRSRCCGMRAGPGAGPWCRRLVVTHPLYRIHRKWVKMLVTTDLVFMTWAMFLEYWQLIGAKWSIIEMQICGKNMQVVGSKPGTGLRTFFREISVSMNFYNNLVMELVKWVQKYLKLPHVQDNPNWNKCPPILVQGLRRNFWNK